MAEAKKTACVSAENLLAYSLGKAPESDLDTISEHLNSCGDCLTALSTIQDADDSLLAGLRKPADNEPFLDEPECQQAVAAFEAIGYTALAKEGSDGEPGRTIPTELGRYQLLKELGRGGMGTVYLAHDTQLDRQVALKIPHFRPNEPEHFVERFYREARAAATIEHPNLCPIYDVGEIDGTPYISMALIPGQSLSALIKTRRRFPERETAEIVRRLAVAVQEAHSRGIVHRDIKPSNVMMTEEGEPILMDFGLARRIELADPRLTHSGFIVGTPMYMAPEQVDGDPDALGPRCDVYSLGVVLYELLTGKVPFHGPLLSVLSQLAKGEPDAPSARRADVDRRLEAICLKAMAKQASDRYQTAAEMVEALQQYLESAPEPAGSSRRRFTWKRAIGAAALFLFFGAIITVATNRGTLEIKTFDKDVKVTVLQDGEEVTIIDTKTQRRITLHAGEYELRLSDGQEGLWLTTKEFKLHRGDKVIAEVRALREPRSPPTARVRDLPPPPPKTILDDAAAPGELLQVFEPPPGEGGGFGMGIAAEDNKVLIGAGYGNAAYLYDARTGDLLHTFRGSNSGSLFGHRVAMAGDRVFVGAQSDDTKGSNAGAVHVFQLNESSGEWEQHTTLYGKTPGAHFGYSIAVSGNDVVVGAPQEGGAGEVYLFNGTTGELMLTIPNPRGADGSGSYFGNGLAVRGNDVLVGALHDNTDAPDAGIAYLFDGTTGDLKLTIHNPKGAAGKGDWFGYTHSVAGVGNNIVVGSYYGEHAYLFDGSGPYDGSARGPLRTFENPSPRRGDYFGRLAAVGNNVLISAYGRDTVYLFDGTTAKLLHTFRPTAEAPGGSFGHTIAGLDGNAVIGAFKARKVYLFACPRDKEVRAARQDRPPKSQTAPDPVPRPEPKVAPGDLLQVFEPPPGEGGGFGHGIAAEGDKVLIGAVYGNAAYLFDARDGKLLNTFHGTPNTYFGVRVAMAGNRVFVGANGDDTKGSDAGAVHVFQLNESSGEWEQQTILYGKAPGTHFGYSIKVLGNSVVVGAPVGGSGEVYLFNGTTGELVLTIPNPRGTDGRGSYFGNGLAVRGNDVLVGALHDNTDAPDAGIVYLFDGTTGELKLTIHNPRGAAGKGDWFGYTENVASVGANILVGTYNAGTAYLFDGTTGDLLLTLHGGNVVAGVGNNALVGTSLFDGKTGDLLHTFQRPPGDRGTFGHTPGVLGNNVLIASFGSRVSLFAGPDSRKAERGDRGKPPISASGSTEQNGRGPAAGSTAVEAQSDRRLEPRIVPKDRAPLGDLLQVFKPPPGEGAGFAHWVAAKNDQVLVGAVYGNAAYLYNADTGALLHTFRGEGDQFGSAVAMAGDAVLVSATSTTNDSTNAPHAGAVYLFRRNRSSNEWEEPIIVYGKAPHDHLGACVASFGDDFLVGAMQEQGSGEAYLLDGTNGKRLLTFRNPRGAAGREDYFGRGLAVLDNDVLIGAPHDDTDAPDAGIVYLFDGTTGELKLTIRNPKGPAGEGNWFGYVHTIAGVDGNILARNYLFDGSTGKLLRTFSGGGLAGGVGKNVVLGSSVFDAKTGDLLQSFPAPSGKGGGPVALGNDVLIASFGSRVSLFAGPDSQKAKPIVDSQVP